MLKKRLIFTLLYSDGSFMLSRNFRLQKVGSLEWLKSNYNFSLIANSIDELIVLDVTRGTKDTTKFCETLRQLVETCFIPVAAGGGVKTILSARDLLRAGADKVVVNSAIFQHDDFIADLASEFGQQSIVASIDIKSSNDWPYQVWSHNAESLIQAPPDEWLFRIAQDAVGEIYLNSIDRDGTGQGYDMQLLDLLPAGISKPVILAGGVGNSSHLITGLSDSRVDAVATANLFNFIGDGLECARKEIIDSGIHLPIWASQSYIKNK